jgi:SAM-dependent methyltransferase
VREAPTYAGQQETGAMATPEIPAAASGGWARCVARLNSPEWRTPVFFEMVRDEILARSAARRPTVLDIGCGLGFDGEVRYQEALAAVAGKFVGIEPDSAMELPGFFSEVHRTMLEDAPIAPGSIDVAYAVMVMEHVVDPVAFWSRLYELLAPGGVFVAFTVNGAHWFASVARLLSATKLKTTYLNLVQGKRGVDRYADYPVYYRTNTAKQVQRLARGFRTLRTDMFGAEGIIASYAPRPLQPVVRSIDRLAHGLLGQSTNLVIRAER